MRHIEERQGKVRARACGSVKDRRVPGYSDAGHAELSPSRVLGRCVVSALMGVLTVGGIQCCYGGTAGREAGEVDDE